MSFLIDSNVLISSYDETEEQHETSYALLEKSMNKEVQAAIAQQNLLEYIAVITDTRRVENPLSLKGALSNIDTYMASLTTISPRQKTMDTFERLVKNNPVTKGAIFDGYLVATALDNGIEKICTWNTKHMEGFNGIEAITPKEVLDVLMKKEEQKEQTDK